MNTRRPKRRAACATLGMLLGACGAVHAQHPEPASIGACAAIEADSQRLACYDLLAGRQSATEAEAPPATSAPDGQRQLSGILSDHAHAEHAPPSAVPSLLDSRWELARDSKLGTLNIRGYKPVFIEPLFVTDIANQTPTSPNPDNVVHEPLDLKKQEAKFQISFKTKLIQGVLAGYGDLWAGYTQSSHWQVYNSGISRPFRETNYEPELMLMFGTDVPFLGWRLRMLGIGVNHQSNGRAEPLSRSWNRVIGRIGVERPGWTILWRPWLRVSENRAEDDNPDITDYLGHGDLQIIREWRDHEFTLTTRHNFSTHRGSNRLTWSFPVGRGVRGYTEIFNGFGESMIDYNHHGTYFGLGFTLLDWY